MKGKTWNDMIKPVVVLVVICILSSAALAGANHITAPIIKEQQAAAANAAFLAVLPEADNFDEITDFATSGVSKVLKAQNGAGWVIQAAAKGFGGDVPAVVGFDADGNIVKVQFMENAETAGFGQKLVDGSEDGLKFAAQFEGKSGAQKVGETVDGITGATVSSKAAVAAINSAVNCFAEVALGQAAVVEEKPAELTAETAPDYLTAEVDAIEEVTGFASEGVAKVMKATNGAGWVIQAAAAGFGGDVPVIVGFNADGTIAKVRFMENTETAGFGQKLADGSDEGLAFAAQFEGKSGAQKLGEGVDGIAGATVSSKAAVAAINNAVNCFAEVALGEEAVVEEKAPELTAETAPEYLAGTPVEAIDTPEGLKAAYKGGDVTVLAAEEMGWEYSTVPMTVMVAFDGTGAIKGIWADVSAQTPGIGDQANGSEYLGQYTGIADEAGLDGVDTIAGATQSTLGVKKAVRKCIQAFVAMNA